MLLVAVLTAQAAPGRVIARHDGHHGASPSISNTATRCSTAVSTLKTSCNQTTSMQTTMDAISPYSVSLGSHASCSNATSARQQVYASGTCGSPPPSARTSVPSKRLSLLHSSASSATNSSVTTVPTTTKALAILPAHSSHSNNHSSSSLPTHPDSLMFTPAASIAITPSVGSYNALADPIILEPGRLPSPAASTSTIYITVTASIAKSSAATSSLVKSTMTTRITSILTKTVKQPSVTGDPPAPSLPSFKLESPLVPTSKSSSTAHSEPPAVYTSIIPEDPRCPYPFPGVYCGEPKTTLINETKKAKASATSDTTSTMASEKPNESGWCPYPGKTC